MAVGDTWDARYNEEDRLNERKKEEADFEWRMQVEQVETVMD